MPDVRTLVLPAIIVLSGCGADSPPQVVLYTSVDQAYAEPTGLVNRLLAEKAKPRASAC